MEDNMNTNQEIGSINISEEVVANVVGIAAMEIDGVVSMASGGVREGIAEFLGKKDYSKGISVEITEDKVKIDISVVVEYGYRIPDVAWRIQQNVKRKTEEMTGLNVENVNVNVKWVNITDNTDNKED